MLTSLFFQQGGDPFDVLSPNRDLFTPELIFLIVIGFGIIIILFLMWFTWTRSMRKKAAKVTPQNDILDLIEEKAEPYSKGPYFDDMPDLDSLVDVSDLSRDTGELKPIVETPPEPVAPIAPPEPKIAAPLAHVETPMQADSPSITLNTGAIIETEDVLTIMRDPRDGRLVVQVDGVGYRTLVDSPEVKSGFIKVMKELSSVVTKPDDNPPAVEAEPEPKPKPLAPPVPTSAPIPPPPGPDGAMPGDLPKFRRDNDAPPMKKGEEIPELNIARAIEDYLQHKIKYSPEYENRNIHVLSALGGGVRIQVDTLFYEAVSDVEDVAVREFLLSTIQEWQERQ
jgi:hypothetical protein